MLYNAHDLKLSVLGKAVRIYEAIEKEALMIP
jgi:hypothetical protein